MEIDKKILDLQIPEEDKARLAELIDVYNKHLAANRRKTKYYEGHVTLAEVNLGLALPHGIRELEIGCEWGGKAVDVLASRSMFDGYVGADGSEALKMSEIAGENNLVAEYSKACRDELKIGCTFATLSAGGASGCQIRFHSAQTASAVWSGEKNRIAYGMAIIEAEHIRDDWRPTVVHMYTDTDLWVFKYEPKRLAWMAEKNEHKMGRPLMEPLIWNATSAQPFGRSRLNAPVRHLIESYIRTVANATIGLEFSTAPQKYLLGLTDDQYDVIVNQKFQQYVGAIIASTTNPETGEKPTFGQLPQGSIEPHVQMMRLLATQFSAATGLSVTDTGVVNDANPTSSDAILAQTQTLVLMAEQLNAKNGASLYTIGQMAQAIARNVTLDDLTAEEKLVIPHFKNPAMPSVSVTADAALKIASARQGFAQTDVFMEMVGFDQADIRRIKAQEVRARGAALLSELDAENGAI